ncbi:MAG: DNA-binding protein [Verrucomicrobiaceae bacterium]|nr:MAG: DNA-binding protein [Verrucomicrobiaceae bacterium]
MPLPDNQLPEDKLSFTLPEWGEVTGESRSYTYEALRDGRLKAKKRGRRTIILRDDGISYLQSLPDYRPSSSREAA